LTSLRFSGEHKATARRMPGAHACQQRFALGQIHAKRFHRQFPPLDRQTTARSKPMTKSSATHA
jgi:hypothetical protein